MKKGPLRWLLPVLQYGLCAVAIYYLATHVAWYDHVRLKDSGDTWFRIVERQPEGLVILRDEQRTTVSWDEVRVVHVENRADIPEIELGIAAVVARSDKLQALWALLVFVPTLLLQIGRLVVMLAIQGVRLSYWSSTKLTVAGNFFNFALPGTTGGDLIKAYYLTRYTHLKTEAVTTVFLDRAIGLFGLVLLAGFSILLTRDPQQFRQMILSLAIICGMLAAGAVVVFSRRMRERLRLRELAARLPMGEQIIRVGRATTAMRHHKLLVALSLLMTMTLQAICMFSAGIMAWALGMQGDLSYYFIYVSIGFLIAAIPITPPQAFGVMEVAYIQFFCRGDLNNDPSQAVALALAVRLIQLVWSLPGFLVPLLGAHLPRREELAELEAASAAAEQG
jgi:uncharacterized protein (TIRG00374 family)